MGTTANACNNQSMCGRITRNINPKVLALNIVTLVEVG
jgi:hypothetical protein